MKHFIFPAVAVWLWVGCSLVIDTDALRDENKLNNDSESDTGPECLTDSDCIDAFDCTLDQCATNEKCIHIVDHSKCGEFEACRVETGCTTTGQNCNTLSDCDDNVDCTIDICLNGRCRNSVDHTLCTNTQPICHEAAQCVPETGGCVDGAEIQCDQPKGGICLTASCNVATGKCEDHLSPGADKDSDSSLDALCGGDDCDDSDASVYPGAQEVCNAKDNDCDDVADASISMDNATTVAQAVDISNPKIAVNGTDTALLWEAGGLQAAIMRADGTILTLDISTSALVSGAASHGAVVADSTQAGLFYIAFSDSTDGSAQTLQVARLEINGTGDGLTLTWEKTLDHISTTIIADVDIAFDDARTMPGWLVAWAENDDTAGTVLFQSNDSTALTVASDTGAAQSVSLDVVAAEQYVLAFVANYAATAVDNDEVHLAEITYNAGFELSAPPEVVSEADHDNAGDDDTDPSVLPGVAVNPSDSTVVVAYLDYLGFGNMKNVAIYDSGTKDIAILLDSPTLESVGGVKALHDGAKAIILYWRTTSFASDIFMDQLIPTTVFPAGYERLASMKIVSVRYPDTNTTKIVALDAVMKPDNSISLAWVTKGTDTAQLKTVPLGTCQKSQ
ncbi:MAG: putative metal-binding motif-containing protein [Deltaproteobacteria bacterium]|nr:putative metal-binding motif-containing protein [Deltaproteobacteria bacterium]